MAPPLIHQMNIFDTRSGTFAAVSRQMREPAEPPNRAKTIEAQCAGQAGQGLRMQGGFADTVEADIGGAAIRPVP